MRTLLGEISQSQTDKYGMISVDMRHLESSDSQAECEMWLRGSQAGERNWKLLFTEYRISAVQQEKLLEICRTTINTTIYFKTVMVVNFLLCMFNHNKIKKKNLEPCKAKRK